MLSNLKNGHSFLLQHYLNILMEKQRSVYIFRRTKTIKLNKLGALFPKKLKRQSFYYEVIEDTNSKLSPLLEMVLVKDVPGVGMKGEKIKTNSYIAYRDFLLPKLAIYADSPLAKSIVRSDDEEQYSSIYTKKVENYLSQQVLKIFMNPEIKWTLEPWHIKLSLRRIGIITSENCITLPAKKINGPDPNIENKDFITKITLNNKEIFPVRCRIEQLLFDESDHEIKKQTFTIASNPLFLEEKEEIDALIKKEKELNETSKIIEIFRKVK